MTPNREIVVAYITVVLPVIIGRTAHLAVLRFLFLNTLIEKHRHFFLMRLSVIV